MKILNICSDDVSAASHSVTKILNAKRLNKKALLLALSCSLFACAGGIDPGPSEPAPVDMCPSPELDCPGQNNIDSDGDGINDSLDQCANTPANTAVNADGCASNDTGSQAAFSGAAAAIPGTIQAEDYDLGGEGNGYSDSTPGNTGGEYRDDDVDIETATGGGYNIGHITVGEWLAYTVHVAEAGDYRINASVASGAAGGSLRFNFTGSSAVESSTINFGGTGGWQTWANTPNTTISLNAGEHVVYLTVESGEFNINEFSISVAPEVPVLPDGLPEAYPGYTGIYPNFTLSIDDRFDTFNDDIWARGDGAVGHEADCRFQDQGVEIVNGAMQLVIRREHIPSSFSVDHQVDKRAYDFSCGEMRTKNKFRYGRIEARFRTPSTPTTGFISSLFTYDMSETFEWREIDIEVEGGRPGRMQSNLIFGNDSDVYHFDWGATRNWGAWEDDTHVTPQPLHEWNVYAIEWTPDYIAWFIDGQEVRRLTNAYLAANSPPANNVNQGMPAHVPTNDTMLMMNFWIPTEAVGPGFGGHPGGNQYPMVAEYDWFRYYEYTP